MFYTIIRPFEGARPYTPGEIVDTATWRHTRSLVERRFIRPATVEELSAAPADVPARRGRPSKEAADAE